ncbi:hypothetical protein N7478_007603 [Penicillium angulare]|uniref:uncharacterized protein n=1 Tax=Penicillium angulare TaxID=116970 RepID=UPI002540C98F|nr:uncharacterized protein N7478_007603 [Penicillium angulare]KAJ5272478.1 hypothetical protein N7478_007603 [Penicillium angulare]
MAHRNQTWPVWQSESHDSISGSSNKVSEESELQLLSAEIPDDQPEEAKPLSPSEPRTKPSKLEAIFRSLGLGIIFTKIVKRDKEYPKVVVWKSHQVALPKTLLHIVPFGISIFLVTINIIGYFIGTEISGIEGYNSAKLGALQFAAKLHEITILASLSMIVFTLVQMRLVSQKVAFGSVFSGLQFQSLSYLWSKELWEVIVSEWGQPHGKLFIVTLLLGMLLAPTVGPSSAVLMVPKLQDWPAGGTEFWLNATRDELWPLEVTDSDVNPSCLVDDNSPQELLYCPWTGLKAFLGAFLPGLRNLSPPGKYNSYAWTPDEVSLPGKYGARVLNARSPTNIPFTSAFCPSMVVADSLALSGMHWAHASQCGPPRQHFAWRNSATWSIKNLQQPITNVACNELDLSDGSSDLLQGDTMIGFPVWDTYVPGANNVPTYTIANLNSSALATQVLDQLQKNSSQPEVFWLDLDQSVFGNNSIGAIVMLPATGEEGQNTSRILACEVDSHWMSLEYQINTMWAVQADFDERESESRPFISALPRIHIDPRWAQYLNPSSSTDNSTLFGDMAAAAGIWAADSVGTTTKAEGRDVVDTYPLYSLHVLEAILAGMITNGLSTLNAKTTIQGTLPGPENCSTTWVDTFFPRKPSGLGRGAGTLWDMTGVDTTNMTRFTMTATANGYAYGLSGATSIASMVVLLVYCAMTIPHTVFVWWTGWTSSSWDSIPELVALALQSSPTDVLKNTGAGISTAAVFREKVQVLDVRRRLRLTFRDTEDGGLMVKANETYE